jgi:hypothetical protein
MRNVHWSRDAIIGLFEGRKIQITKPPGGEPGDEPGGHCECHISKRTPMKLAKEPRGRHMERIRKELAAFEKRELEIKAMERKERQMQLWVARNTKPTQTGAGPSRAGLGQ